MKLGSKKAESEALGFLSEQRREAIQDIDHMQQNVEYKFIWHETFFLHAELLQEDASKLCVRVSYKCKYICRIRDMAIAFSYQT